MDELINLVTQRTGLPADKARVAVETVLGFVKSKLPPAIASHIDGAVGASGGAGGGGQLGGLGDVAKGLGGIFGGGGNS